MFIDHPAILKHSSHGGIPDTVMELKGLLRVGRRFFDDEAGVDHHTPMKPMREMTDELYIPFSKTIFDGFFLCPIKFFNLIVGCDGLSCSIHPGHMQAFGRII